MTIRTADIDRALLAAGAERRRKSSEWRLQGLRLTVADAWLTISEPTRRREPRVGAVLLDDPGLWKDGVGPGGAVERVFDLPLAVVAGENGDHDLEDPDGAPVDATTLLAWALATRRRDDASDTGSGAASEPALDPAAVERCLPEAAATLRAGERVERLQVVADGARVAVRAELGRSEGPLPRSRRRHLERLLRDLAGVRMVRAGWCPDEDGRVAVRLEIDLTGAPAGAVPDLVAEGAWILRWSFAWLAEPVSLLLDADVSSRLLDELPADAVPAPA